MLVGVPGIDFYAIPGVLIIAAMGVARIVAGVVIPLAIVARPLAVGSIPVPRSHGPGVGHHGNTNEQTH